MRDKENKKEKKRKRETKEEHEGRIAVNRRVRKGSMKRRKK